MNGDERTQLQVVEAKVDNILTILNDPEFGIRPTVRDHEKRLRSVERWKYSIPAALLLAAAAVGGSKLG